MTRGDESDEVPSEQNEALPDTQIFARTSHDKDLPEIPDVELTREIGRGGMGVVYLGKQKVLNRKVAVKLLSARHQGGEYEQRFFREARIMAGMSHPNIVGCHSAGKTTHGSCFLVMEFVDGPNLLQWLDQRGKLATADALRVCKDVAIALGHAHESKIIHRDIKPANVLLQKAPTASGSLPFVTKLADLGLARPSVDSATVVDLTVQGAIMGSPPTMAPEQFDDPERVDYRADIYGLGCVLFQSLTGKVAYPQTSLSSILASKMKPQPPDPRALAPDLPRPVCELVVSMLASDRSKRPQSYTELVATCDRLIEALSTEESGDGRRWTVIAAGVGALAIVSIAGWKLGWGVDGGTQSALAAAPTAHEAGAGSADPEPPRAPPRELEPTEEEKPPPSENRAEIENLEPHEPVIAITLPDGSVLEPDQSGANEGETVRLSAEVDDSAAELLWTARRGDEPVTVSAEGAVVLPMAAQDYELVVLGTAASGRTIEVTFPVAATDDPAVFEQLEASIDGVSTSLLDDPRLVVAAGQIVQLTARAKDSDSPPEPCTWKDDGNYSGLKETVGPVVSYEAPAVSQDTTAVLEVSAGTISRTVELHIQPLPVSLSLRTRDGSPLAEEGDGYVAHERDGSISVRAARADEELALEWKYTIGDGEKKLLHGSELSLLNAAEPYWVHIEGSAAGSPVADTKIRVDAQNDRPQIDALQWVQPGAAKWSKLEAPIEVDAGLTLRFKGQGSDAENSALTWTWTVERSGKSSAQELATDTGGEFEFTAPESDEAYALFLTATLEDEGALSDTQSLEIAVLPVRPPLVETLRLLADDQAAFCESWREVQIGANASYICANDRAQLINTKGTSRFGYPLPGGSWVLEGTLEPSIRIVGNEKETGILIDRGDGSGLGVFCTRPERNVRQCDVWVAGIQLTEDTVWEPDGKPTKIDDRPEEVALKIQWDGADLSIAVGGEPQLREPLARPPQTLWIAVKHDALIVSDLRLSPLAK